MRNTHSYRCRILLLLMSIIALTFLACAPQQAPAPESKIVEKPLPPPTQAKTSWEQQWEDLVKKAQKEGKLSIYSGLSRNTILALRENFKKKYGIDMEIVTAGSSQLDAKLFTERQAGLYIPDLYLEGPTSPLLVYKPKGILQPLDKVVFRPDALDEKVWWKYFGPYFDKDHYLAGGTRHPSLAVLINTKMVRPEELTSYNDLLAPKWKSKIILGDPTVAGGQQSFMVDTLVIMGEDYIRRLSEQIGVMTRDKRLVVEWVVRGKYPVGFGASPGVLEDFGGADVEMIGGFKEGQGTTGTGVVVFFDRPPNPNAAKLFINWLLTREGQQVYSVGGTYMSRRLDVSDDHLPPSLRMKEGVKYLIRDEEYYSKKDQYMEIVNKYYRNR